MSTKVARLPSEEIHAAHSRGTVYGAEVVINLPTGRQLRAPAYPAPVDYVRITDGEDELAYWVSDEWQQDPQDVMGAIVGSMIGPR